MMSVHILLFLHLVQVVLSRSSPLCTWTLTPTITHTHSSSTSVYLEWTAGDTNAYEVIRYEGCLQTPGMQWETDSRFYLYPTDSSVQPLNDALSDDSNWNSCTLLDLGKGRSYTIKSLNSASVYRVAVRAYAKNSCEVSIYSPWKVITTTGIQRYVLEAEGTGSNNHLPARITLNNQVLLQRDDFRGLYLHAFSRFSLKSIFSGWFDTQTSATASDELAAKLESFDESVVVVLVSCDAWEDNVTKGLLQALKTYGAKLIIEVFRNTYVHQPYLFIGIREIGQIARQSVESLRANRGLYLYDPRQTVKIPTARGRIVLRKNTYRRFYYIETASNWQYDDYDRYYLGSLRYLLPDIREANTTLNAHLGFVIKTDYGDIYSADAKETELDRVWVDGPVARYDFTHKLYSPGADLKSLPQTPVIESLLSGDVCEPPYTAQACSKLASPPLMLQCGVGITPYNCGYLGLQQVETTSLGVN